MCKLLSLFLGTDREGPQPLHTARIELYVEVLIYTNFSLPARLQSASEAEVKWRERFIQFRFFLAVFPSAMFSRSVSSVRSKRGNGRLYSNFVV
jgi:hypothetical protein